MGASNPLRAKVLKRIAMRIYGQSQDDVLVRSQEEEGFRKSGISYFHIINCIEVLSWLPITHPEDPCAQIVFTVARSTHMGTTLKAQVYTI